MHVVNSVNVANNLYMLVYRFKCHISHVYMKYIYSDLYFMSFTTCTYVLYIYIRSNKAELFPEYIQLYYPVVTITFLFEKKKKRLNQFTGRIMIDVLLMSNDTIFTEDSVCTINIY